MTNRLIFDPIPKETSRPLREVLERALESIRSVLDVSQGGLRVRESIRVIDCVIDTGATPTAILKVPGLKTPPLAVLLLRATNQRTATGQSASGFGVQWEWRGALLIHSVDGLSASTRYDCALAVLE